MSNNNNMNHSYKLSGVFCFFLQTIKHYRKSLPWGVVHYQKKVCGTDTDKIFLAMKFQKKKL